MSQDNAVCERVQRGVRSRAFDHGIFPAKDSWVLGFDERYPAATVRARRQG